MRIKKAVDIHKMCFEISFLLPNQGDTLSYIKENHCSYDIAISVCVTVEFQDWDFRLQSFSMWKHNEVKLPIPNNLPYGKNQADVPNRSRHNKIAIF